MPQSVSLVTTCMDRNDFLRQTLPTWLKHDIFKEIIIVDYSSRENCASIVDQYQNGKIILIRVPNQQYFHRSKAKNVGIKHVTSEYTLMIDADVKIANGFDNVVFDGNCRHGSTHSSYGTVLLPTNAIKEANGYNEYMVGYGHEDTDLYNRIKKCGYRFHVGRNGLEKYISHINHSRELRVRNHLNKNISETNKMNRRISVERKWGKHCSMEDMREEVLYPSLLRSKNDDGDNIEFSQPSISLCIVSTNVRDNLSATLASWLKYDIFERVVIVSSPKNNTYPDVVKKYQNGKIFIVQSISGKIFNEARCKNIAINFVPSSSKYVVFANCGSYLSDNFKKAIVDAVDSEIIYNNNIELLSRKIINRCGKYDESISDIEKNRINFSDRIKKAGFRHRGSFSHYFNNNTVTKYDSTKIVEITVPNQNAKTIPIP